MEQPKEYYAFISYKREDEKWAKWLLNHLENYRIPKALRNRDTIPQYIRPIFMQSSDIALGALHETTRETLRCSKCLIVICSPQSARSEWVNKEIQTFLELGREAYIIPFIVDGIPHSEETNKECLPLSLLNQPNDYPIINVNEVGPEAALEIVIARLLNVCFDVVVSQNSKKAITFTLSSPFSYIRNWINNDSNSIREDNKNETPDSNVNYPEHPTVSQFANDSSCQGKEYHINNSTIKVAFGNILDSHVEVIVSSDDCNITMGGGVSTAIWQKEGTDAIRLDVKKKVPADIGDVVVSTAGTLPQKNIFHVITIGYNGLSHANLSEGISKDDVHKYIIGHSIDKCFLLLHAMGLTSIAFPQIGAGVAGIPFKKVAEVMADAIGRNLRKTNKAFNVEIYLYDRFEKMNQWDFLPMFEQFSAQEAIARMLSEQANDRLFSDNASGQQSAGDVPAADKDIFISYSRKDVEIVKAIYEWLERAGYKCWLDVDGMFSGVSYKKVIVDAIKRSKVLLFMSSENSNKSRNVVNEVSIAVEYGKKIIPVRLDMSSYSESIEYDIINHDYVVYDRSRVEESNREMLKKIVSTMEMV